MKLLSKNIILPGFILLTVFFIVFPQQINAQDSAESRVSVETQNLLRAARIQVINPRTEPQDFTLPLLTGGNTTLSSHKGKVVILNFWATWCPPCRTEMPSMEILYQRYKDQGLEMLTVNLRENIFPVRQFINNGGYTFPVLMDNNGRIGSLYGVEAIPTTFIIDREGKIVGRLVGSIYWDTPQVFAAFEALLVN